MVKTLPLDWSARTRKIHQDQPFVWCWDLQLEHNPTTDTRAWLTPYPSPLTTAGKEFQPYPIMQGDIDENAEGDLPQLELNVSNHGRVIAPYLETVAEGDGLVGSIARGYLVNTDDLSQQMIFDFRVGGVTLTDEWATLRLEMFNFFKRRVPNYTFNPQVCGWRFGTGTAAHPSPCGYIINAAAAYTSCNKDVADCILRGDDEDVRNLPRLHPLRFGGFLGIPQQ